MPTYNYGRYIRTALESIRIQTEVGVEVVVLDGGSEDDTGTIVQEMAANWPQLRYIRQAARGGIDFDMARSVELANGDYCWLLSADDALQPGAVRRIMSEITTDCDILLCNRLWCDANLRPIKTQTWLRGVASDSVVDMQNDEDLLQYLRHAQSLGALFSYMSCIGFRRDKWIRGGEGLPAIPCYTHVARLFDMGRMGARLKYLEAPLVLCRSGNDSFSSGGLLSRLMIDLRGFLAVGKAIFPENRDLQESFLRTLRREHPWWRWVRVRGGEQDICLWKVAERHLFEFGFSRIHLHMINAMGRAFGALRSMRAVFRKFT